MTRLISAFVCGVAAAVVLGSAAAAASPWDGTWKLNPAKSKMTGYTFSYKALPDGKLEFSNGAQFVVDFACDGKPYTVVGTSTIACTISTPGQYHFAFANNGATTSTDDLTLLPGGDTMKMTDTNVHPDGTSSTNSETFARVAGGPGIAGTWKQTEENVGAPDSFTFASFPGGIDVTYPAYEQTMHLTFDGKPSLLKGPRVSPNTVTIATATGPLGYSETDMVGTKIVGYAKTTVSPDGKTMTTVSWDPGKENEAATYVYEKQ